MGTEAPGQDHAPAAADAGGAGGAGAGRSAVFLPALLALAIVAVLLPAVLVKEQSGAMLAKVAAAALLSLLPGWLYVQFIKNKGHSLYDEYVLNLFRLHIDEYANLPAPPQHTSHHKLWKEHHDQLEVDTKDNLYREKFQSVYGRGSVSTLDFIDRDRVADDRRRRMQAQTKTFSPVMLATFLFALGWALVLQPERWTELEVFGDALSDQPELPNQMLRFGFVGAYAFILQDIVRRYFRDDLKASAYVAGVVRIVFVTLVLVAVNLVVSFDAITDVGDRDLRAALAFLVGFFPQLGLQVLHVAVSKPLGLLIPTLKVQHPLSDLDGLNIWYEARLAEEGVEDMQNLVSANLVDLMLHSRAPIARLVDWIDQALLCLHLPASGADGSSPTPRAELRQLGIRTASDLKRSWEALGDQPAFRSRVGAALGTSPEEAAVTVQAILQSLEGHGNFWHVEAFKAHRPLRVDGRRAGRRRTTTVEPVPAPATPAAGTLVPPDEPDAPVVLAPS